MILGLISIILGGISVFGYRHYSLKNSSESSQKATEEREGIKTKISEINSGQPEISIRTTAKPFLRYLRTENGLEISYEFCFKNSGNHAAIDFKYNYVNQSLIINNDTIYSGPSSNNNKPPKRIVSDDKFCQIFKVNNGKMSEKQIQNVINQFELNSVFILSEIKYSYKDEVTGKQYSFIEKNRIKKDRVDIL
tara:strand:- start:794 stop:1372 length:579 start_codon:yes stop_codon:yes gene_type:complete